MRLNTLAFSLTCGLVWGFGVFFLAWWVMAFEGATGDLLVLGHVYRGFNISPLGSVFGLLWGLADGFIGGLLVAIIYNAFVHCRICEQSDKT